MNNMFLNQLSDHAIMSLHRFYSRIKLEPWGYKKFPNCGERLAALEQIIEQRIPADHIKQIQRLTTVKS